MYNIWCEVKKENIVLVIIGIIMTSISFFIDTKIETLFLFIITLLLILYLIKSILKFLSLKKNGIVLNNVPYHFENLNDKEKVMIVEIEYQNAQYKLFKKQMNWNNVPDNGMTNVIINPKKSNQYYIFLPQQN